MPVLQIILSLLSILIIILMFLKPLKGVMLYLIYFFLAPNLIVGDTILGTRTVALLLLAAFMVTMYKHTPSIVYKQIRPFLLFYGLQFFLIPFSFDANYSLNAWMLSACKVIFSLILASAIYLENEKQKTNILVHVFCGIFILIIGYGLFLTTMPGLNPYQMILQPIFGGEFNEAYAAGNSGLSTNITLSEGRLFGRISSVFNHPMTYVLAIGLFFIFLFAYIRKKWLLCIFLIVTSLAIITSGVRTPIAALGITGLFMLIYYRKYKFFFYAILVIGLLLYIVPLISEDAADYIASIFNSDDSATKGSSLEMRLSQLDACLKIIADTPFVGKGIDWTGWYMSTKGGHPQALFFESLLFVVICNMGFVGIVLWIVFVVSYIKTVHRYFPEKSIRTILYGILVYYISFAGITGEYGYLPIFMVFYVMVIGVNNARMRKREMQNLI